MTLGFGFSVLPDKIKPEAGIDAAIPKVIKDFNLLIISFLPRSFSTHPPKGGNKAGGWGRDTPCTFLIIIAFFYLLKEFC